MLVNLNEVLLDAQKNHYGVGLFNTIDTDMLEGAITAAEELSSPIIIGTAESLLPYGELKLIAPSVVAAAKRAKVPVVVQLDHGRTYERCVEALSLGFSSIMFDGSVFDYETNIERTKEIVKLAHTMGATVEGEIGHVGLTEAQSENDSDSYTTPEEAKDFYDKTGVDALAIAIGTAHGEYKATPKLDIQRLKEIRAVLDTPLVLHGGSGLSDEDFKNTIKEGIAKVNIFTDLCLAGNKAALEAINAGKHYKLVRNAKVEAIKEAVMKKILLFGSNGKY